MAKQHRRNHVTASFHYLVKVQANEKDPSNPIEGRLSKAEFDRVVRRISEEHPLNLKDKEVILKVKSGQDLPFGNYELISDNLHFGSFEGAYYGQKYRNNVHGDISADSLNLRKFHYLLHFDDRGRVVVGVTYNGQFGDYDGMRSCLVHLIGSNSTVTSRSITSLSHDIGEGKASEITLYYRKSRDRDETENLFGRSGAIAIKRTEFGDGFDEAVEKLSKSVKGDVKARQKIIAQMVNEGDLIELDDSDIVGCTAVVREGRRRKTVYFLGHNNFATRFPLAVQVDKNGVVDDLEVRNALVSLYENTIFPMIR